MPMLNSLADARFQSLHRIACHVPQDAEELIVVGFDGQAALESNDPPDRDVEPEPQRLVDFFDPGV
jgi:hypothetical protein